MRSVRTISGLCGRLLHRILLRAARRQGRPLEAIVRHMQVMLRSEVAEKLAGTDRVGTLSVERVVCTSKLR